MAETAGEIEPLTVTESPGFTDVGDTVQLMVVATGAAAAADTQKALKVLSDCPWVADPGQLAFTSQLPTTSGVNESAYVPSVPAVTVLTTLFTPMLV